MLMIFCQYPFDRSASVLGPEQCADHVNWQEVPDVPHGYRAHLRTSVTFPVSANIISFITEGARSQGSLEVSQTAEAGSDAIVEVDVFYRDQEDFDEAHTDEMPSGAGIV